MRARDQVIAKYEAAREQVPAVDVASVIYERDRATGGDVIAGALAFRLFLFLLPLVLVVIAGLGFVAASDPEAPETLARRAGIAGITAQSVARSIEDSSSGRWFALVIGLVALYTASVSLVKALRTAHALAWRQRVAPLKRAWRAVLALVVVVVGVCASLSVLANVRNGHRLAGFWATIGVVVVYAGLWVVVTNFLPHGDAPWTALVPGAVLFAVGLQVLHLVTVYYVAHKVSSSSDLYGPIGVAIAILGWAFLFGRLTVGSAMINATLWERHQQREAIHAAPRPPVVSPSARNVNASARETTGSATNPTIG
jgi:uncharacterized BrkB/YihY/UPF0761 family membrane protein